MGSNPIIRSMNAKEFIKLLDENNHLPLFFVLPSGEIIPRHFHVTEVGRVTKDFYDCGGEFRRSIACVLQIWVASDVDHRLSPDKLSKIMSIAADLAVDHPVEVEYGTDVITQYSVSGAEVTLSGLSFMLSGKQTCCLAPDKCGVL